MGHWSENTVADAAKRLGIAPDTPGLREAARQAAAEIELLAGRAFGVSEQQTMTLDGGGLPFIDMPDLQTASTPPHTDVWPLPDPAHPQVSTVLQLLKPESLASRAGPLGDALAVAGKFVSDVQRAGWLSGEYLIWLLGTRFDGETRDSFLRTLINPSRRVHVPIASAHANGWWFQISRRLVWISRDSPDDQRLIEPLIVEPRPLPLAAVEPTLIVARLTSHPVDWAMSVRIWPPGVPRRMKRPWPIAAESIHKYGVPILTVDDLSTRDEIACQLVLVSYWHGYVPQDDPAIVDAVARAYPRQIASIRSSTGLASERDAAALLLEGLLHPGFDPDLGAGSVRRYISRKARIAIANHRKTTAVGQRRWELLGVSERQYYKLIRRFSANEAEKSRDVDAVHTRMRQYLSERDRARAQRSAAMGFLQQRGFSYSGARKWLQRNGAEKVREARPRWRRRDARGQKASRGPHCG